jgi:hypothetical protein
MGFVRGMYGYVLTSTASMKLMRPRVTRVYATALISSIARMFCDSAGKYGNIGIVRFWVIRAIDTEKGFQSFRQASQQVFWSCSSLHP